MAAVMTRASWSTAAALGVLTAAAVVMPAASQTAQRTQQFVLAFEMASPRPVIAEIFVDRGAGFEGTAAIALNIAVSAEPLPYVVPLSPGRYRRLRIDPMPDSGDFVLQAANVRDRYGRIVRELTFSDVEPSEFVAVREKSDERIVASALPGHVDPNLQLSLSPALFLWLSFRDLAWYGLIAILIITVVTGSTYFALQHWDRSMESTWSAWLAPRRPRRAIALTAFVSAIAATYPLLLGRSLVTPNNGPTPLVYGTPPYVAGATDAQIESARLADVQATMWVVLPYAVAQRAALAHGEWPWWNRYSENGAPLLGQGQGAFFDPLQWLLYPMDLALGADLKFVAARVVFTIGTGLAALVATESFAAALVVTIAAPFISHFIGRFNDPIHFSIVYAPWILLAFGELSRGTTLRGRSLAAAGLLVATALLIVSSSLKETFALLPALYLAGSIAIVLEGRHRREFLTTLQYGAWVAAAGAGAVLLSAPHWLTFLETLSNAFTAYDAEVFSFARPAQAMALVAGVYVPGLIYPGVTPVVSVLALIGLLSPRALLARPLVAGCGIVSLAMLLIAFGVIPERLLAALPMFSRIHHVGMTFVTAALPLILIVAAAGASQLAHDANLQTSARAVVIGTAVAVALTAGFLLSADLSDQIAGVSLTACVWTGVLAFLLLSLPALASRGMFVVAVIIGVMLLLPGGLHLPTGVPTIDSLLVQPRERVPLTMMPAPLAPIRAASAEPARIAGMNGVLQSGVPTYLQLETVTGGDSLFSPHTFRLGTQFEPNYYPLSFRSSDPNTPHLAPLLDLWGVRWLAMPASPPERLAIVERTTAWPRAYFVDRVERYEGRAAFVARLRADPQPFAAVDEGDAVSIAQIGPLTGTRSRVTPARDYQLTANTTTVTIDAPTAGVMVVNETFWPGVSAVVGDQPATVFRVNEMMRGIAVPQGTWRVTLAYRPATWSWSLALAATGAATLLALLLMGRATTLR